MPIMTNAVSRNQILPNGSQLRDDLCEIGLNTAAGALAAHLFSIIHPIGGAIFGASITLTRIAAIGLANQFSMDQTAKKIALMYIPYLSAAVGIFAVTMAGFPLTLLGTAGLALTMVVTQVFLNVLLQGSDFCHNRIRERS